MRWSRLLFVLLGVAGVVVVILAGRRAQRIMADRELVAFERGRNEGLVVGAREAASQARELCAGAEAAVLDATEPCPPAPACEPCVWPKWCSATSPCADEWSAGYAQGRDDWNRRPFLPEYSR